MVTIRPYVPAAGLAGRLRGLAEVLRVEDDRVAWLNVAGGAAAQHQLLKAVLALDLPVCEFAQAAVTMQEAYLETIRQPR